MKVSGFTFIRNGTLLGYPYIESIKSILPIVDEFVVNVGYSDDDTLERIKGIVDPKIRIIESAWNEKITEGAFVYAQQTMIALYNCTGDWAFYIQGDEVVHENDLPNIKRALEEGYTSNNVEGLVFDYLHFFGDTKTLAVSPGWYRREVRAVKTNMKVILPSDAQFFIRFHKRRRGRYLNCLLANASIYHYGHARSVEKMRIKIKKAEHYYGKKMPEFAAYNIDSSALAAFQGTHPRVLEKWISEYCEDIFNPDPDYLPTRRELKHRWMMLLENMFRLDLSKKHYKLIR